MAERMSEPTTEAGRAVWKALGRNESDARRIVAIEEGQEVGPPPGPDDEHAEWYRQGWVAGRQAALDDVRREWDDFWHATQGDREVTPDDRTAFDRGMEHVERAFLAILDRLATPTDSEAVG